MIKEGLPPASTPPGDNPSVFMPFSAGLRYSPAPSFTISSRFRMPAAPAPITPGSSPFQLSARVLRMVLSVSCLPTYSRRYASASAASFTASASA